MVALSKLWMNAGRIQMAIKNLHLCLAQIILYRTTGQKHSFSELTEMREMSKSRKSLTKINTDLTEINPPSQHKWKISS
jgi:hypothetical protein